MKVNSVVYQFVEFIPERIESGVLYISQRYGTAMHKCCCGCGEEVVTPLNPTDWSFRIEDDLVTLHPSIGNWSFACNSHYWIRRGVVVWSGQMSQQKIKLGREFDRAEKKTYFEKLNRIKSQPSSSTHPVSENSQHGLLHLITATLRRWLNL